MKQWRFGFVGWCAAWVAVLLAGCGGGGGSAGNFGNLTNVTPSAQAAAQELVDVFAATLNGAQEVPRRASAGNGSGTVSINSSNRQMSAVLTTAGIAGIGAQIHQAPPGVNGPIIFTMTETSPGSGVWTASATLTEAQFNAFKLGEFYFNVQSLAFGGGEIRGQIVSHVPGSTTPSAVEAAANTIGFINSPITSTGTFLASLRGSQEVPSNASNALGAGTVLIDPASRQMTAAVSTVGIAGTSAHIHEARPGVSGPIIIPLVESATGSGVWTSRATLTEEQYATLKAGNLYFNVHSAAFPAGEIRGQILPQQLTTAGLTGTDSVTGATGSGTAGTGTTGTGATGTGTTGTGVTGTGTTGTGATGIGTTGTGLTGTGSTGTAGFIF